MKLASAEFDFQLAADAYLCFVIKEDGRSSGVRLSTHPAFKSVYFEALDSGEFVVQRPVTLPSLPLDAWVHARYSIEAGNGTLEINGQQLDLGPVHSPEFCQPGFRGGERSAAVDNVTLRAADRLLVQEDFANPELQRRYFLVGMVVLFVLSLLEHYSQTLAGIASARAFVAVCIFNAGLVLLVGLITPYLEHYLSLYPTRESLLKFEASHLFNQWDWRRDEVVEQASAATARGEQVILFVGSSQTFGAGASLPGDEYVSVVQRGLDATPMAGPRYRCINAGINGTGTPTLLPYYQEHWAALAPTLVVIDLAINDRWNSDEEFAANLSAFIQLNQERKIKTLLIVEPHSLEWLIDDGGNGPGELSTQAVVKRVAAERGVPLVNAHEEMQKHAGEGFLWWDFVHPTSFGHRILGESILPHLKQALAE